MTIELSPTIYLDTSFIVEAYEAVNRTRAPVKIVRTEDVSTTLSLGIISGGASAKETKEFPMSSREMFADLRKELATFPIIDFETTDYEALPEYFWTIGMFGFSASETTRGKEVIHRETYFRLYAGPKKEQKSVVLLTNDVYFTTGYDSVHKHLAGACKGFAIQVQALLKVLSVRDKWGTICAPLVMEKIGNSK